MSDDCIAGNLQGVTPAARYALALQTALCAAQLTKKICLPDPESRTTHFACKKVRNRLKWDEWNGSADNMQSEILRRSLASVTPYLALLLHDLYHFEAMTSIPD